MLVVSGFGCTLLGVFWFQEDLLVPARVGVGNEGRHWIGCVERKVCRRRWGGRGVSRSAMRTLSIRNASRELPIRQRAVMCGMDGDPSPVDGVEKTSSVRLGDKRVPMADASWVMTAMVCEHCG